MAARGAVSRAWGAVLVLLCLLSLIGGDRRALCLDLGGECSPSASIPTGPCHEGAPQSAFDSDCSSCIDIVVPDDASARGSGSGHDLPVPTVSALVDATSALHGAGDGRAALATHLPGTARPLGLLAAAVLRI